MPPELVIFDLGNVLVRITLTVDEAFARTEFSLPSIYSDPDFQLRLRELHLERETGRMHDGAYYEIISSLTGMTPQQVVRVSEAWLIAAYDGAADFLHSVCGNGYQTACLSNTNAQHIAFVNDPRHVGHLPLHKFDYRFFSYAVGAMKPEPAIYEHVEQATGIAPERMLFFDDRQENIDVAQSRGWGAVLVDPRNPIAQMRAVLNI